MAKLDQAKSFWRIMKSVSVTQVADEARRKFAIAVVGAPERRRDVLRRLYPDVPDEAVHPLVRTFDSVSTADGFPQEAGSFDIVLDAGGGRAHAECALRLYSVDELGGWDAVVDRLLDERPDLALSLARRFPGLRDEISRRIIRETATANAQFAMLNALPGIVPVLGILLPTAALGDVILLAKNQAMMLYRLAAAHDLPLDLRTRAKDIAPLAGNAFGWRALAREVVGFVPGGIGLPARGAIAYAGTAALGEAMRRLYALGEKPTRGQMAGLYRESLEQARDTVGVLAQRIRAMPRPVGLLRGRGKHDDRAIGED